jgi:hypothetical protein
MPWNSNYNARIVSCELLSSADTISLRCDPLSVSEWPKSLTVAPYLSEIPLDPTALFSKRSPQETKDGWKAATENRMREMARIVKWKDEMENLMHPERLTIGVSQLPQKSYGIADFDRSNPRLFVESHWEQLPAFSIVATHKYLIVPLLTACKGDWFWKMIKYRREVINGAVLATTWMKDGESKQIFFVRHCLSCANFLNESRRSQRGSKATMCLNVDAVRRARCVLRKALGTAGSASVRLFSSGQPRAMQTALALISDAVDTTWLRKLALSSGMYTDCADDRLMRWTGAKKGSRP